MLLNKKNSIKVKINKNINFFRYKPKRKKLFIHCRLAPSFKKFRPLACWFNPVNKLNQICCLGLENKIISLQQRLTEAKEDNKALKLKVIILKSFNLTYRIGWSIYLSFLQAIPISKRKISNFHSSKKNLIMKWNLIFKERAAFFVFLPTFNLTNFNDNFLNFLE